MSEQQRGLGRGIDTLFRNSSLPLREEGDGIKQLSVFKLVPGAGQPRQIFADVALDELAASIRSQGVIQPLLVRPLPDGMYEIVAGERRWRAAKKAGLLQVPVIIRELSDAEALTMALVENLQREDLNPLEEARAMATLRDKLALSQEDIAARIGKSRSAVANALRLLQLPEVILLALQTETVTAGHARALLALPDENVRMNLFQAIREHGLSVRDVENAITYYKQYGTLPAGLQSHGDAPAPHRTPRMEKTAEIKEAQARLRACIHPRVTISGSTASGRITLPYESPEALGEIINALAALKCELRNSVEMNSDKSESAKEEAAVNSPRQENTF